jgi:tubulin monoglycylase TTLL3/8
MKKIACWTMIGAKSKIKERPNSYEVFGIDYMIDINYNTWLIEINKNPALEYSTVIIIFTQFYRF